MTFKSASVCVLVFAVITADCSRFLVRHRKMNVLQTIDACDAVSMTVDGAQTRMWGHVCWCGDARIKAAATAFEQWKTISVRLGEVRSYFIYRGFLRNLSIGKEIEQSGLTNWLWKLVSNTDWFTWKGQRLAIFEMNSKISNWSKKGDNGRRSNATSWIYRMCEALPVFIILSCLHRLTDFYNIWYKVYWDNKQHNSYCLLNVATLSWEN